jgi:hypothetical protein
MNSIESELTDNITTSDVLNTPLNDNIELTKTYSHNDKKLFVKRIGDIKNKKCYVKIFKIIHGDNYKYTKNDNGVFFNLTNLSDSILTKIEAVLIYYENRKSQSELLMKSKNDNSYSYTEDSDMMSTSDRNRYNKITSHSQS